MKKEQLYPLAQRLREIPDPDDCIGLDGFFTEEFERANAARKSLPPAFRQPRVILGYAKAKIGRR